MAEVKKAEAKTADAKAEVETKAEAKTPELKPASESTDAAVQQLLAQRVTAFATGDGEAAERVAADLAERGYK